MSHRARVYVFVLGLASCAAWITGVVLLPLAVWLTAELAITLGERATQRA